MENRKVITVSELNEYIKMLLDRTPLLNDIYVKGEISNFTNHYKTGHFYFTIKDENSVLRAVMFRSSACKLTFMPENGMKVICGGRISAYPKDGSYQIYATSMEPDGIGALYIAYEQLKKKLEEEGLFSQSHKLPLPKIPSRIGVITSPTGAAIKDIINVSTRRFPHAEIILYPALVQGSDSAKSLIAGLDAFEKEKAVDVIIIGRGGGSLEELWSFNDEALARRIYDMTIPIISAVGHERDYTICDFVADMRAPTPSAAAEIAVPETEELKHKISNITGRIGTLVSHRINLYRAETDRLKESRVLLSPANLIDDKRMATMSYEQRLFASCKILVSQKKNSFTALTSKLDALNPLAVLSRGFSAVYGSDGKLIKDTKQVKTGDNIAIVTRDGKIDAEVKNTVKTSKEKYHG